VVVLREDVLADLPSDEVLDTLERARFF